MYTIAEGKKIVNVEYEHKGSVYMLMCNPFIYSGCFFLLHAQFLTHASEESVVFPDGGTLPPTACGFPVLVAHSQSQEHCQLHLLF